MRMIVIDERTDLPGLKARLVGEKQVSDRALEQLKELNPHVNFKKIAAGTVLLIPDLPGLRKGESSSVQGGAFEPLRNDLLAAMDGTATRVLAGYETFAGQQKEVTAAVKSAAFKRALETDPDLRDQVEKGMQVLKDDQEQARATGEMLKEMRRDARDELEALTKLLG